MEIQQGSNGNSWVYCNNISPAYEGIFSVVNAAPLADLTNLVFKNPKIMTKTFPRLVRRRRKAFEDTEYNFMRSVSVLYKGGIASKAKYRSIKKWRLWRTKTHRVHARCEYPWSLAL